MACYDCEDCNYHIDNGGKCAKFEYDCTYSLIENTDENIVSLIRMKAMLIEKLLDEIKELDEGTLYYEISSMKNGLTDIIDYSSEQLVEEWKQIQ